MSTASTGDRRSTLLQDQALRIVVHSRYFFTGNRSENRNSVFTERNWHVIAKGTTRILLLDCFGCYVMLFPPHYLFLFIRMPPFLGS